MPGGGGESANPSLGRQKIRKINLQGEVKVSIFCLFSSL